MGIPVLDQSNSTSNLITTRTGNKAIKIFNKKIQKGLVPDVVGMGLIDAVYILEKLAAEPRGASRGDSRSLAEEVKSAEKQNSFATYCLQDPSGLPGAYHLLNVGGKLL